MITTTKKIAERAQNDPNFKDELCVVFSAKSNDPRNLIDIANDLTAAMFLLTGADGVDDSMMCSLYDCIFAMSINSEQTRLEDGKIVLDL